ncbi:Venom metalloproteinase 3 [Orchesella cincta]|uniref:Venom metalloproteinase 3 n=1 Tax=Orchesella cincta TaxID=48709 RepID=A0A1D2NMJ7_ORCCI|nr:Venom metalloproteinase 3 [Orchesella cincta]
MKKLILVFVAFACANSEEIRPEPEINVVSQLEYDVTSDLGKQYNLKLTKAEGASVLHPNIKVISVGKDNESGFLSFDSWTPSKEELRVAEDVYVDANNLAAVHIKHENGKRSMLGVVDGMKFEEKNGAATLLPPPPQNRTDYIDIGRKLTASKQGGSVNAVVEVVLVLDKEFGDIFQHDRRRILDYFTVYFWDINLRYKTLPSNSVSFRITGIIVISSPSGQPFIEEARASDGRAEFGRILERFSFWVYKQMSSFPKFDMAVAITNTRLEWGGGLAYMRAACSVDNGSRRHWGTLVFNDGGNWQSMTVGAHELAHTLGAPHDDDPGFPGGCQAKGYIMSGGNENLKWFFSTCSDRTIGEFVRSNEGACLRRIDENGSPAISSDFSSVLAPTMEEQCKRRLNNPNAFMKEEDKGNCKTLKCWVPRAEGGWLIWSLGAELDNTPCTGGRCFRGRCRKQGNLIRNVGDGRCLRATNPFEFMAPVDLVACPEPRSAGTPLDRFVLTDESIGRTLATPWSSRDASENGDKCVYTGYEEGGSMWTDRCNSQNSWHGWEFISVGNGEFMISHRNTKRCAKPNGAYIATYSNCNRNDFSMRWRLE